jgi:hypothetical protein
MKIKDKKLQSKEVSLFQRISTNSNCLVDKFKMSKKCYECVDKRHMREDVLVLAEPIIPVLIEEIKDEVLQAREEPGCYDIATIIFIWC